MDCPTATYIVVPIHGQLAQAFIPGSTLQTPNWITACIAGVNSAQNVLNSVRPSSDHIDVQCVPGMWMEETRCGTPDVLESRWLYMKADHLPPSQSQQSARMQEMARQLEVIGRFYASRASRAAADRISSDVADAITTAQDSCHGPIFVDLIGHSRGGAVAGQVYRNLLPLLTPDHHVYVSVTLLDAIDPLGLSPFQLHALAGDLLDDPGIPEVWPVGRITNYHAEHAALGSWYPSFIDTLAGTSLDESLVNIGYPRGRSRTIFDSSRDFLISGTTHNSLPEQFAATVSGPYSTANPFSFAFSTRLGELLIYPFQPIGDVLFNPRCGTCYEPRSQPPTEYVGDPDMAVSWSAIGAVQSGLADPEIAALLTPDLSPVPELLTAIANSSWIEDSLWHRVAGTATVFNQGVEIPPSETVWQDLDRASLRQNQLRIRVRGTVQAGSSPQLMLHGPGMNYALTLVGNSSGAFSVDTVATRSGPVFSGTSDRVSLVGGPVQVSWISVAALCSADFNNDGDSGTDLDIENFFACIAGNCCATCDSADFDGDGDVGTDADIESFFRVLAGGPC
jgi:hypothetical protein